MLNECREAQEYENLTAEKKSSRLLASLIKVNGKGIVRALTLIARRVLFEEKKYDEIEELSKRKQIINETLEEMKRWCFGENSTLYQYCLKKEAFPEKRKDYFEEKKEKWYEGGIYDENPSSYSFNFREIIADAITQGPLKKRYLICKSGFEKEITYETAGKEKIVSMVNQDGIVDGKQKQKNLDRCLKIISSYLLLVEQGSEHVRINKTDLANWMQYPSYANKECFSFFYQGEELLEERNGRQQLNSRFLEEYDVQLVEENDLEIIKKEKKEGEYILYEDMGAGEMSMKKHLLAEFMG